ncbi:hypothetical protein H5410_012911 [Solanum commersonii]|uniref:Uncharacterized protein n=1 Tax=Solanum commersonii TaxID=4109 RepID=A0A9J6ASZ0_SOLCO|nr:hypothetical protein H5410_012911 [Solanum commersonii]
MALCVHTYKHKGMWNKVDQIEKLLILESKKCRAAAKQRGSKTVAIGRTIVICKSRKQKLRRCKLLVKEAASYRHGFNCLDDHKRNFTDMKQIKGSLLDCTGLASQLCQSQISWNLLYKSAFDSMIIKNVFLNIEHIPRL